MFDNSITLVGNPLTAHDSTIVFDNVIDLERSCFIGNVSIQCNTNDLIVYWNFINNCLEVDVPAYVDKNLTLSDLIEINLDRGNIDGTIDIKYMKKYVENGLSVIVRKYDNMIDVYEISILDKYGFSITKNLYKCVLDSDGYEYPNVVRCQGI